MSDQKAPAGWYADPSGSPDKERYWDGETWSDSVRDVSAEVSEDAAQLSGLLSPLDTHGDMKEINRGKKLLIAAIAITLAMSFLVTAANVSLSYAAGEMDMGTNELVQGIIRFSLECALFACVYQGFNWARILSAVLYGIAFAISLLSALAFAAVPLAMLMMLAMSAVDIFAVVVFLSKPVRAYQYHKRPKKAY